MNLGELILAFKGDFTQLDRDITEAKRRALANAQEIEKQFRDSLNLNYKVQFTYNSNDVQNLVKDITRTAQEAIKAQKIDVTPALTINNAEIKKLGQEVAKGLAQGIKNNTKEAQRAANELAGLTIDETKRRLRIKSPSRVFAEIGQDIVKGLAEGIGIGGGLSVTGAISGLVGGAINTARNLVNTGLAFTGTSINKFSELSSIESQLKLIEGSTNSLKFIREESDRLSISLNDARKAYVGLAASAKGTELESEVKRIFSAVSSAARVFNLSNENYLGALTAIQQIISKNKITAEELRGQLGERLYGAVNITARALGITTQQLDKLLESGQLSAKFLSQFATQLEKELGQGVEQASKNSTTSLNRLQNQVLDLQESLGKAVEPGVVAGLDFAQKTLSELLKQGLFNDLNKGAAEFRDYLAQNPELAKQTAQAISGLAKDGIKLASDGARSLLDYLKQNPNAVKDAVTAFGNFGKGIGDAVKLARDLLDVFDNIGKTIDSFYDRISKAFGGTSEQQKQFENLLRYGPLSFFFQGNQGQAQQGLVGGLLSGLGLPNSTTTSSTSNAPNTPSSRVISPVDSRYPVTSEYGWRYIFGKRQFHKGIDYGTPVGTDVKAPTSGIISRIFNDNGGGLTVTLQSMTEAGQKVEQSFLHLSRALVKEGDRISQGQVIAKSGASGGRSTGPHLDWRIKVNGQQVNPRDFLRMNISVPASSPTPQTQTQNQQPWQKAAASWYGRPDGFHGRKTASGEIFNADAMTLAHKTLPFGTKVELRNPDTGTTAIGTVNDRGPFVKGREFDLSQGLAGKLGVLNSNPNRPNIEYRIVTQSSSGGQSQPQPSTSTAQQPPEIRAILQGAEEKAKVERRNALRATQDQIQSALRAAREAYQGSTLFPSADERNTRQSQQRLQQIDDQIVQQQRQREDAQSRIKINQTQISSGSLSPEVVSDLNNQINLDTTLIQKLDESLKSLQDSRRKTSEEYAKFNERDRQFRQQQSDLRVFQSSNEILVERIEQLRELSKLNPYAKELEALPHLEKELQLNQQQIKINQDLLNLENQRDRNEIDQQEYLNRLNAIKNLNAEELKTIDIRHKLARTNEFLRQGQLKLDETLRRNSAMVERLRTNIDLRNVGIGTGDRITLQRDADLIENKSSYLQQRQQLQERALLEELPIDQIKTERLQMVLRFNERNQVINDQAQRNAADLIFNNSNRVNQSGIDLINNRADYLDSFGLSGNNLRKQAAISSQELDFNNQLRDLQNLKDIGDITAETFAQLKANLEQINQVRLDAIKAQFDPLTGIIRDSQQALSGFLQSAIIDTNNIGDAFRSMVQNIIASLAKLAAELLTQQIFKAILGWIGIGVGGGAGSPGGGSGGGAAPTAYNGMKIPNYADGGIIGNIQSIGAAALKERQMTGRQPYLVVASAGERILNHRETEIWERLQQSGRLNFADGGVVGMQAVSASSSTTPPSVTIPITINAGDNPGFDTQRFAQKLHPVLKNITYEMIQNELRQGGAIKRGDRYGR
ncbi:septal ring lytic transglycosylase RlpA family protein [Nostoc sp. FACHB-190]|uniref:septal ring lytic transglycosylase RlpA family protein n=1 Tax=Nostoc sp. FACHB-190 TaxID=2692838 RepID=UPI0016898FA9|nr:septal ring lytic transglycosylase RlpA family protein [Nostoc sp. FACHB-190]MBD2298940.1 septal ring lytic transglycosylase RlpA family protein [Nostoc sp. FACHB-190]